MLALKLLLVPALIGAITLVGQRWGPTIAGWLSGFPVVAGPILLLVAIEQGPLFAANASGGALSGVLANTAFCIGYSWSATRLPWWGSLIGGLVAYASAALLITTLDLSVYPALILTFLGIGIALKSFPGNLKTVAATLASRVELPARMLAGATLVLVVTYFASTLGPRLSGLFSAFPLMACVLASFSHPTSGAGFAIRLLRGMVSGFFGLAVFCFSLAVALPTWGTALGFFIALACATLVQAGSLWLRSSTLVQPARSPAGECESSSAQAD
jgi:hypothetical protein